MSVSVKIFPLIFTAVVTWARVVCLVHTSEAYIRATGPRHEDKYMKQTTSVHVITIICRLVIGPTYVTNNSN